jgi:hypothetical protein
VLIDLNKKLKGLDGKEIPAGDMNKIIANVLAGDAGMNGKALKYYDWAVKLYNGEKIDIDKTDYKNLISFVENSQSLSSLAKAQILDAIEHVE